MEYLQSEEAPIDDLMELVQQIVAFHMQVLHFLGTLNLQNPDTSFHFISALDNCKPLNLFQ